MGSQPDVPSEQPPPANPAQSHHKTQPLEIEQLEHVDPSHPQHRRDAAATLVDKISAATGNQRIIISPADNARVLRRIDLVILPLMLTVYFLQGLDKATLSYASVFGLISDTGLVGTQYSWLGSIVYVAQLVMQPFLAWALVKLPIGKFTAAMVLCWGIVLSCMAAAHNFGGLVTTRFFLGAFEAGIAPSFVAITQMWWRRREQTMRVSYWYAMNGFTSMFGSLITWGLGHIKSELHEYQIIFLFFGLVTIAFSVVMFIFMPDSPIEAKFLKDEDKYIAIERLRMNQMGVMSREWRWDHLKESFLDIKTWFWFSLLFAISVPSGGISTFGPLIIQSFDFDSFHTILLNIPFGAVQLIATVGSAYLAMRLKKKGPVIMLLCIPPIAGCIVLLALPHEAAYRAPLLVGYYLISVYPGITPLIYAWSSQNTAGDTKRKCTNAILFIGQSVGNIVGPLLYTVAEKPGYHRGLRSNLALFVVIIVLVFLASLYLVRLNKAHARRRVAMGKSEGIVDTSLWKAEDVAEAENMRAATGGEDEVQVGDKAFENLTDLMNEEFVFVY